MRKKWLQICLSFLRQKCSPKLLLSSPPKSGRNTQFSAYVYCGQTAGWMKTPLGTEVDLGHTVLIGTQLPTKGAQHPPLFDPCLLWPPSPISATTTLLLFTYSFTHGCILCLFPEYRPRGVFLRFLWRVGF